MVPFSSYPALQRAAKEARVFLTIRFNGKAGFQENFISVVDEDFQCCICRFPLREPLQLGDADTVSVASDSKMLQQGLKINLSLSLLFTIQV